MASDKSLIIDDRQLSTRTDGSLVGVVSQLPFDGIDSLKVTRFRIEERTSRLF